MHEIKYQHLSQYLSGKIPAFITVSQWEDHLLIDACTALCSLTGIQEISEGKKTKTQTQTTDLGLPTE